MNITNKALIVLVLAVGLTNALADDVNNSQEQTAPTVNSREQTTQIGTAQDWSLTPIEWQQYQKLMQGEDGLWYAHLSPPAVLGMRAKTQEEQRHFAEIVAKQEHDKVARELAFNQAILIAMRSLYPDEPMIKDFDKTPFNPGNGMKN